MVIKIDILAAGGVELMSAVPMGGNEPTNSPVLQDEDTGVSYPMGLTAEMVAAEYSVSRKDQDSYSVQSHQSAIKARDSGRFDDEIIPIDVNSVSYDENGPVVIKESFRTDELIRPDTNLETLEELPTIFKAGGTVTAASSAPLTDGTGFVILMSGNKVKELGVSLLRGSSVIRQLVSIRN